MKIDIDPVTMTNAMNILSDAPAYAFCMLLLLTMNGESFSQRVMKANGPH
jgi:hypothetical protein